MESKEPNIEEIEKYLTGQMSAFDTGLFEVRLSSDEALREQLESVRMAIEVAKQYRAHELKLYIEKNAPKVYKNTFWQTTIIYAVAASLVLLSASYGVLVYFDKDKKQVAQEFELKPGLKDNPPEHLGRKGEQQKNEIETKAAEGDVLTLDEKTNYISDSIYPITKDEDKKQANKDYDGGIVAMEDIPATIQTADNFKVQTDELLLDTNFTTYLAMEVPNAEKKALKKKSMMLPQSTNSYRNNQTPAGNKQVENNNNETDKSIEYKPQQMLNVEFWKSPVNYKGYRYNTKKMIVYGMKPTDMVLIKVKGTLYIKSAGQYYKIEENDRFNNFWPETVAPVEE